MERKRYANRDRRTTRRRQEENVQKETIYLQACVTAVFVLAVILMSFFETDFTRNVQEKLLSAIRTQVSVESVYELAEKSISVFKNTIKKDTEKVKKEEDSQNNSQENKNSIENSQNNKVNQENNNENNMTNDEENTAVENNEKKI